ncbi:Uncharacterised protein [Moraxella ovis]|uniref:Uncharacterized protein n=2 Tax=Moraxella ovis TaxID=29433 RepID=A0A378PKU6_9GAMM|nr:Uncharacterised protein [Moraxella ovis]
MFIDMNNPIFINQLTDLSKNRFALDTLSNEQFFEFYQTLLSNFNINLGNDWYLIGTDGCHLCDEVYALLGQIGRIRPLPFVHRVDVMNADELVIETLGVVIPILVTPARLLCYPFGAMDIMTLTDPKSTMPV